MVEYENRILGGFTRDSLKIPTFLLFFNFSFPKRPNLLYRSNTYTRLKAVTWTGGWGSFDPGSRD